MTYFSPKLKVKALPGISALFLSWKISLRSLKRITLALMACLTLAAFFFWRPVYLHWRSGQEAKLNWQTLLQKGSANTQTKTPKTLALPTLDQLPDMIDRCCSMFGKEGVEVYAFNVERFGELRENGKKELKLDYGLVRLRLHGQWEGIISSLKELEQLKELSIHVQEVALKPEGGETLLRIDFCTDMERNIPFFP